MKFLFVHQNFPGQYLHIVRYLALNPANEIIAITQRKNAQIPGVKTIQYSPKRRVTRNLHHYMLDAEAGILNGQEVARIAIHLRSSGFVPDVMLGHNGWGEIWFLKDVFPTSPLIGYFEFFYRLHGSDVDFGPDFVESPDDGPRLRLKNAGNLLGLDCVDWGQCPTEWQRAQYPYHYQSILHQVHEGIDTSIVRPDSTVSVHVDVAGIELRPGDEVVTYVSRNLETYRGFEGFMRSLPHILEQRPRAHVLIVGGDDVSYGPRRSDKRTLREVMLEELGDRLDYKRVHFLGRITYAAFLKVLQVSSVHIYLTYPFVLSWSMLEAMAAGCLVIGSKTAPVEEVLEHGKNGMLADFFNPDEIARLAVQALACPSDHVLLRAAARETVIERFDLKSKCLPAQLLLIDRISGRKSVAQRKQLVRQ